MEANNALHISKLIQKKIRCYIKYSKHLLRSAPTPSLYVDTADMQETRSLQERRPFTRLTHQASSNLDLGKIVQREDMVNIYKKIWMSTSFKSDVNQNSSCLPYYNTLFKVCIVSVTT